MIMETGEGEHPRSVSRLERTRFAKNNRLLSAPSTYSNPIRTADEHKYYPAIIGVFVDIHG